MVVFSDDGTFHCEGFNFYQRSSLAPTLRIFLLCLEKDKTKRIEYRPISVLNWNLDLDQMDELYPKGN